MPLIKGTISFPGDATVFMDGKGGFSTPKTSDPFEPADTPSIKWEGSAASVRLSPAPGNQITNPPEGLLVPPLPTRQLQFRVLQTRVLQTRVLQTRLLQTRVLQSRVLPEERLLPESGNNGQILRLVNGQWIASDEQTANLSGYQQTSQKNQAGGYAGLNSVSQIAGSQIPLSPDSGNILEIRNNKLYATAPSGGSGGLSSVSTSNSTSVKFTGNGTPQNQLSATVARSATPGLLIQNNDGLSAPLVVNNTNPTKTVQLSGGGTASDPLSASVNISPDAGNAIENREGKLYVATVSPDGGLTAVSHTSTNSATITGNGTPNNALAVTVKRSVTPGLLTEQADGLAARLVISNTNPLRTVLLSGLGTALEPLAADVQISTDPGNAIENREGKLYVASVAGDGGLTAVTHQSTGDIAFSGTGAPDSPLIGNVQNEKITFNKMQRISGGRILGASGTGEQAIGEIQIGGGLNLVNNVLSAAAQEGGLTSVLTEDTPTVDFQGDGTMNAKLKASVHKSANPGILTEETDGLAARINISNTNPTRTVQLSGNGTAASPLSAQANISNEEGNLLQNLDGALHVSNEHQHQIGNIIGLVAALLLKANVDAFGNILFPGGRFLGIINSIGLPTNAQMPNQGDIALCRDSSYDPATHKWVIREGDNVVVIGA